MIRNSERIIYRPEICHEITLKVSHNVIETNIPADFKGLVPLEIGCNLDESSSQEASERSNSALISAFVFSCGIEQSANALSALSLQVLKRISNSNKLTC